MARARSCASVVAASLALLGDRAEAVATQAHNHRQHTGALAIRVVDRHKQRRQDTIPLDHAVVAEQRGDLRIGHAHRRVANASLHGVDGLLICGHGRIERWTCGFDV